MRTPVVLEGIEQLATAVPGPVNRVFLITGNSRRFLEQVRAQLDQRSIDIFDGAKVHVPETTVAQAERALAEARSEAIVAVGGGGAIGLAKVLRRHHDLPFVAVPTTFAASEFTDIWGTSGEGQKTTGRDARVVPDAVIQEWSFLCALPQPLLAQSLLNAIAHPISALATDSLDGDVRARALSCLRTLLDAAEHLARFPKDRHGLEAALRGLRDAGLALRLGQMGAQHKLAHLLGGRFTLPHAPLHAILLPQFLLWLGKTHPALMLEMEQAAGSVDLPQQVFELLRRSGAPSALRSLDVEYDALQASCAEFSGPVEIVTDAWLGRPASRQTQRADVGGSPRAALFGEPETARDVVVAIHGRGSAADGITREVRAALGDLDDVAIVAPQAERGAWYGASYRSAREDDAAAFASARQCVVDVTLAVREKNPQARVWLVGFSQGACLALSVLKEAPELFDGVLAAAGALVRPDDTPWPVLSGKQAYLSLAADDTWVDRHDVEQTAMAMRAAGATVALAIRGGAQHVLGATDRRALRSMIAPEPTVPRGYLSHHEVELKAGALPRQQNNPRRAPYGLYAEQINGTGFVAPRNANLRTWTYRVRPSAQHTPFEPCPHPGLRGDFTSGPPAINMEGWRPPEPIGAGRDFVEGLVTLGGAGSASLRRGYALHVYATDRDMEDRSFTNADGDLVVLPQSGRLAVQTEFGWLDAAPGTLLILPRGLRFSVFLPDGNARGYVGEIFARHFVLPERGVIGANGLADPRHFEAPRPAFEDRVVPGFEMIAKMGGELFRARQDFSPYDVVAWHGNYVPYRYDLARFSPVNNTRFDHGDPSLFTVLSAELDETGANALDLVVFPPRWDSTEHTFRNPFFHRNVTTEFNGIIRTPARKESPFRAGMSFLTPSMTAHGVLARSVDAAIDADERVADRPVRMTEENLWFQFESALPFVPSGADDEVSLRIDGFSQRFGSYRTRFAPDGPHGATRSR